MLINLEPFGRLGNRLFLGAHFLVFGLKHGIPTLNLGFSEYASHFPWMEGNHCVAYPWRPTGGASEARLAGIRHWVREHLPGAARFRYWGSENFDFDRTEEPELLGPLRRGQDVYLRAWLFRGFESLALHRDTVLEVFRPSPSVETPAADFISQVRSGADHVVGVHVRWEDYRGTENFLDQPAFRARMEAARNLRPDQKVRFVLFSNETLPTDGWGGLDVTFSPASSVLFDLSAMGRCDSLMAPPSTFSGWASFYGEVPLLTLRQTQPVLRSEDFQVCRG